MHLVMFFASYMTDMHSVGNAENHVFQSPADGICGRPKSQNLVI